MRTPLRLALVVACMSMATLLQAQSPGTGTVSGTITDAATLEPLEGVAVEVVGTSLSQVTDAAGQFRFTGVPAGSHRIRATRIGFASVEHSVTLSAAGSEVVNFDLMPQALELEGIVAVGYTAVAAEELTSSASKISPDELRGVTTEDVATMLQGKVSGVTITEGSGRPGDRPDVRIRGTGSILAAGGPLYVVDGIIADTEVAQSVPSDNIESVTVLKDAAATALYGSRAANGVIVITTRSGADGDTEMRITSSVGTTEAIFGDFRVMDSEQFYAFRQAMGINDPVELRQQNTNWRDLVFSTGTVADVNLSASGGNERTRAFVSGGYFREEGTAVSTGFDRITGRLNLSHAASDRFDITARAYGSYRTYTDNPGFGGPNGGILRDAFNNLPYDAPYSADGTLRTGLEPEWMGRERRNFLYDIGYNWTDGRSQDFGGDLELGYDITSWLRATTTNRATFKYARLEAYEDARTQAGSGVEGALTNETGYSHSVLTSNLLHVDRHFGDHSLRGLVGAEYQRNYSDDVNGLGTGLYPGLAVLSVAADARSLRGGKEEHAFASALSQVNYGYLNRYFLTGSYRRDGSSRFGADNRWGDFYSLAGAWLISDEPFFGVRGIDQLKLRASYGTTGNANIGNYLAQSLFSYTTQYAGTPGSLAVRQTSPELTWEVAHTANVGVDMRLVDRIDMTLDVYRRVNSDLLQNVPTPTTSGFRSRVMNVGSVRNQGVELGLSTLNVSTGDFTWSSDFNVAWNDNEVTSLHNGDPVLAGQQRIMEGHDIATWFQRKWLGVDPATGDPLWETLIYDDDGEVIGSESTNIYNDATLQAVGDATPDVTGGMRNTFSYGPVTLSGFFTFVSGLDIYHSARERFDSDGAYTTYNNMVLKDGWTRWEQPGDDATHPKLVEGGNQLSNRPSSRYLEDGSYLRLRNVTLSFDVPFHRFLGGNAGTGRVYLSGDNLLTLTEFSGMDPESNLSGLVSDKYPLSKRLLIGVEAGF